VNLIITDQWQLKLIDFSTVDMIHPLSHSQRRNTRVSDTGPEIQMRSQLKAFIKKKYKNIPIDDGLSQSSRIVQYKTTQDYFQSINDIDSIDHFVLLKVLGCFEEIIIGPTAKLMNS
jgi:hypothetical protein